MNRRRSHRVLCIVLAFLLIMSYSPMAFGAEATDTLKEKKWTSVSVYGVNVTNYGSYTADLMVDGIIGVDSSMWHTVGTTSEAYVTLDLGCAKTVTKVISYARPLNATTYTRNIKDYEMWLSDTAPAYNGTDGTVPGNLATLPIATGTMTKCGAGEPYGTLTLPEKSTGRYLTIHIKNVYGDCINIQELEVYTADDGSFDVFVTEQPIDSTTITPVGQNVVDYGSGYPATKLLDGITTDSGAGWFTSYSQNVGGPFTSAYITFKLKSSEQVSRMDIYPRYSVAPDRCVKDYAVYVSDIAPVYGGTNVAPTDLGAPVVEGTLKKIDVAGSYGTIDIGGNAKGQYITLYIKNIHGGLTIDLAEIKFYSKTVEVSFTDLELDYENKKLIMPTNPDYEVSVYSSSNTDAVTLDGALNSLKGGSSEVVLKLENKKDGSVYYTAPFSVFVNGLRQEIAEPVEIAAASDTNHHAVWPASYLINGELIKNAADPECWSTAAGTVETADVILTLAEENTLTGVTLYPRYSHAVNFPKYVKVYLSNDGGTWTEAVVEKNNIVVSGTQTAQTYFFEPADNVRYVKFAFEQNSGTYIQLAEIEVLGTPVLQTIEDGAAMLSVAQMGEKLIMNYPSLFEATILSCDPDGLVDAKGNITMPEQDTETIVTVKVADRMDAENTTTVTRTLLIKSQATLDLEALMLKTNLIPCPENDATKITLPSVPEGYAVEIAESDHPAVVDTEGNIKRSDDTTYGVRLTLKITDTNTGDYRLTKPLLVPIYKTFVAPTMTQEQVDAVHADWKTKKYGIFVHYVASNNQTMYRDGTYVTSLDELAEGFDAVQFAKDMGDLGVEYVVLTLWHANAETLFPSMTNQRWRDDRRDEGSDLHKSYSDRDVIDELLTELDKYGVDLHLYTHPSDGHDFAAEDQLITGWNDSTNQYATWNQYVNELYYEVCERYGTRIKGFWLDGLFSHVPAGAPQARFKETCTTFNPAMILTMNNAFVEGSLNSRSMCNGADYHCWEINRYVDYENDLKFSRHQVATCLAGQYWWTKVPQSETFKIQPSDEMFRYLVALSSVSSQGGLLASTGFYAKKEGESSDDLWLNGMKKMLFEVNSYLDPVAESVKGTSIGKAFPTSELATVSQLSWGVSTESPDGKNIYLHVLKAPSGNVLTLPETADGTILGESAVIMNFDGKTTEGVAVTKTESGYTVTLPEGASWNSVDTVIKAERKSYDESIPVYEGDKVFYDDTVDGYVKGTRVLREVEGKEVYLIMGESITGRITDNCYPVVDGVKQVHFLAREYEQFYVYDGENYAFYGAKAGINPNSENDITKPNPLRASDEGETVLIGAAYVLYGGSSTLDGFTIKGNAKIQIGDLSVEEAVTKEVALNVVNCRNSTADDAYATAPTTALFHGYSAEHKIVNFKSNRFDGICFNGISATGPIVVRNWEGVVENNFISIKNSVTIGNNAPVPMIFWLPGETVGGKDWDGRQDVVIQNNWLEGRVSTTLNPMWYDEYKVHILNNTIVPTVGGLHLVNITAAGSTAIDGVTKYYSGIDTADILISGNKIDNKYNVTGIGFTYLSGTVTASAAEQVADINNYKAGNIKITHNEFDYGSVTAGVFGGNNTTIKDYANLVIDITCNKYGETITTPVTASMVGQYSALNVTDETAHKEVITVEDTAPTETVNGVGHTVCNFCGELIAENVVIPATGEAKIGDTTYATLEEALSAAAAGQTVTLNKDASVDFITVDPKVTLDLGGHVLTAGYVIGFATSAVIDSSKENSGKLIVDKDKVALDKTNGGYLPVYEEGGYIFTTVKLAKRSDFVTKTQFAFSPVFETFSHEALMAGHEKSNVNIIIRLTWEDEGNYRAVQDFTYLDERVHKVIKSYDASKANYDLAFAASFEGSEAGQAQNVQVTAVVVSDTGVEIAGTPVAFAGV